MVFAVCAVLISSVRFHVFIRLMNIIIESVLMKFPPSLLISLFLHYLPQPFLILSQGLAAEPRLHLN